MGKQLEMISALIRGRSGLASSRKIKSAARKHTNKQATCTNTALSSQQPIVPLLHIPSFSTGRHPMPQLSKSSACSYSDSKITADNWPRTRNHIQRFSYSTSQQGPSGIRVPG